MLRPISEILGVWILTLRTAEAKDEFLTAPVGTRKSLFLKDF